MYAQLTLIICLPWLNLFIIAPSEEAASMQSISTLFNCFPNNLLYVACSKKRFPCFAAFSRLIWKHVLVLNGCVVIYFIRCWPKSKLTVFSHPFRAELVTGVLTETNENVNNGEPETTSSNSLQAPSTTQVSDFEMGHSRNSSQTSKISGYGSLPSHSRQGSTDSGQTRFV